MKLIKFEKEKERPMCATCGDLEDLWIFVDRHGQVDYICSNALEDSIGSYLKKNK